LTSQRKLGFGQPGPNTLTQTKRGPPAKNKKNQHKPPPIFFFWVFCFRSGWPLAGKGFVFFFLEPGPPNPVGGGGGNEKKGVFLKPLGSKMGSLSEPHSPRKIIIQGCFGGKKSGQKSNRGKKIEGGEKKTSHIPNPRGFQKKKTQKRGKMPHPHKPQKPSGVGGFRTGGQKKQKKETGCWVAKKKKKPKKNQKSQTPKLTDPKNPKKTWGGFVLETRKTHPHQKSGQTP